MRNAVIESLKQETPATEDEGEASPTLAGHYLFLLLGVLGAIASTALYAFGASFLAGIVAAVSLLCFVMANNEMDEYDRAVAAEIQKTVSICSKDIIT